MHSERKEVYIQPALVTHELLRDITAGAGSNGCANGNPDAPGLVQQC